MEPESEQKDGEMTVQQAADRLGVKRQTVNDFLRRGALSSRLVLEGSVAKRLIPEADVEQLLKERTAAAARQTGKGRPIVLPKDQISKDAASE
jgi:excisionase family DNA binding protein